MISEITAHSKFAIKATDLSVVLGEVKILDIPSLEVYSNEVLIIMGPNGSGKTTLLLSLALLLKPAAGKIFYQEVPVINSDQILRIRRKIAIVFQESLLLNSTVLDNITLGLRLRGIKGNEAAIRSHKWLERFAIAHLAKRQARTLSGGEAKRVSLARAFVLEPEVLFLDEPFNALDSPTRQALLEDFESVLRETKVTTVMVTHDRNEALSLADRIAMLMKGSVSQLSTPAEIFGSPANEEVANFVEVGNVLHGVISSKVGGIALVDVSGQQIQVVSNLAIGSRVAVYLRYDDVTIVVPPVESIHTSARNQLRGRIVRTFLTGCQLKVTLDCGFSMSAVITTRSWEELGLEIGQEVVASFKASSVHLISRLGQPAIENSPVAAQT